MPTMRHQYVERSSGRVLTERLYHDRTIRWLYSAARERTPALFRALTSGRTSRLLGTLNYDLALGARLAGGRRFLRELGIDWSECLDPPESLDTPRKVFERRIRYWECRPLPPDERVAVSPCDARALVGSFAETSRIWAKEKFFRFDELLGEDRPEWQAAFRGGDFCVLRLTPDKYHYNHAPVSGVVRDLYEVAGDYHSCNPSAVVALATPYSKNKRVVTVIDSDASGGSGLGLVAMVEIVALMIGQIDQCYSDVAYDDPRPAVPGTFLKRGQPKSLFRPGSSTVVVVFQPGRVEFAPDLVANLSAPAESRFSHGFGRPLVETDVVVRSAIAAARGAALATDCDSRTAGQASSGTRSIHIDNTQRRESTRA